MPRSSNPARALATLQRQVIECARCPRLIAHCREVALEKRRMYRAEEYWGKPVPSFGDPRAQLLIVGLAPGAHGSNRTGRMFTGDPSGDFLFSALHKAGFASQAKSLHRDDGLTLKNCYITAVLRCAPPGNKPWPEELRRCRPYLEEEMEILTTVRAVLALGRVAFDSYLRAVEMRGNLPRLSGLRFLHGESYQLPADLPRLFTSYHPSQQNTQTGKLTPRMMNQVLGDIRKFLAA